MQPVIIGIAGGTGAGKSTLVKNISTVFKTHGVAVIPQDAYYNANTNILESERKLKNYDHPDAIDWLLLQQHIIELQNGNTIHQPVYSMLTCSRKEEVIIVEPAPVILVDGILIFTQENMRNLFALKIFMDADLESRFQRIVKRDMQDRGRNLQQVNERFTKTVQPMHIAFIEPSKIYADIIITGGGKNAEAIQLATQAIKKLLGDDG
ncbi:MAG: uridine kinase [Bacteroidetes bacterium]|nr:uridine kinase [Bacteroidota bacterium]MBP7400812.1 uridine kinase [Chitinophagales bacterium]MBK7110297.1 uridine kinase [Bacteroidota bacterium]MBK8681820.1 uridine kinase [Bacteroidota bacterium]MBP8752799.1 uridine kinase [Chitinophagales bacterium]